MAETDHPEAHDNILAITSELAIVGFFFAMRSCEFTTTPNPGRTKIIRLGGIVFRDNEHNVIAHNDTTLSDVAERVTLTFENQKNGQKMDKRTHQRTQDPVLCPVRRLASIVDRIYRRVPGTNTDTKINAAFPATRTLHITSDLLRKHMRNTCTLQGGAKTFGFDAADIGTKSLRSGAAMSLFLMNHPVHKIMILGRWSSDAFLVYIRPQVLEWTNNMSRDMINNETFLDATDSRRTKPEDPRTRETPLKPSRSFVPNQLQIHH